LGHSSHWQRHQSIDTNVSDEVLQVISLPLGTFIRYLILASVSRNLLRVKGKGKEEYLYSAFSHQGTHKALRHGSHSFTCKQHHACHVGLHYWIPYEFLRVSIHLSHKPLFRQPLFRRTAAYMVRVRVSVRVRLELGFGLEIGLWFRVKNGVWGLGLGLRLGLERDKNLVVYRGRAVK